MNTFWINMKIFFGRIGCYLFTGLIYRYWSRLYRLIWEYKYRNVELWSYKTFMDLVVTMRTCKWAKDGWHQLWDAFSYPGKVQHIINTVPEADRFIGDCDEFAIYLANVITQNFKDYYGAGWGLDQGRFPMGYNGLLAEDAKVLTVMYVREDGSYGGHNVCLIYWRDGKYSYMDYDLPNTPESDIVSVVRQVMDKYAPKGTCIGWATHSPELKLQSLHWKLR